MEHNLIVTRFSRGRGPLKGDGTLYGTKATCACGGLVAKTNEFPPSRGGNQWAKRQFQDHVASITPERELELLREKLARSSERLANYARQDYAGPGGLERWAAEVADLSARVIAAMKSLEA